MKKTIRTTTNPIRNQVHPPCSKKTRMDAKGNEHIRLWLKDHDTTMLFAKNLTRNAASVLINNINTTLKSLGVSELPKNKFLITR